MIDRDSANALVDIAEVARRLGVEVRFVRRLVAERRIDFHKVGRLLRFDPADVERFIQRSRVPGLR
jgi:excisionase family DNA binding protein